ncbi:MAG: hypothetical protein ABSH12_03910, partial [Endomicrobiales bacterium]
MENQRVDHYLHKGTYWGMAILLAVMPLVFNADFIDAFNLPKVILLRVVVLLAVGAWAVRSTIAPPVIKRSVLDGAVIVFLCATVITTVCSVNVFHSFWGQHMYH